MVAPEATCRLDPASHPRTPKAQPGCHAVGQPILGVPPSVPPTPDERHNLRFPHVKIPPFRNVQTHIRDTYGASSRTTRLATVTAAAAVAAVAAGVSASPAMAATGTLASAGASTLASTSTLTSAGTGAVSQAASHSGPFRLDAASMTAPLGRVATPAGH